ncbi:hypothetical protein Trydic_g7976 [Trypoxylus dichotomus]
MKVSAIGWSTNWTLERQQQENSTQRRHTHGFATARRQIKLNLATATPLSDAGELRSLSLAAAVLGNLRAHMETNSSTEMLMRSG